MGKEFFSKIKLLKIWEILKQDSDELRPLSTNQIIEKLNAAGIACDRRTLYADIAILNSYGYEVLSKRGRHSNLYYVVDRNFDVPELRILMDAVQAAGFITEKKTGELVDKIAALGGSHRAALLKNNIVRFNTTKHTNEMIYYSVDKIGDAILSEKKISFRYFDYETSGEKTYRKQGRKYIANPIATVFSNDNYYLICYHDNHKKITSYRIDRMTDVEIEDADINRENQPKNLNISAHRKQAFNMFSGDTIDVRFVANKDMIDVIFDKFGEDIKVVSFGEDKIQFTAQVQISNVFFGWCCSFGDRLKVDAPTAVKQQLTEYIQKIMDSYFRGIKNE